MSFGISGNDPFKSYSSNADSGGGMGVYSHRRPKNAGDEKEEEKKKDDDILDLTEDDEDVDVEIDFDDTGFLE